MRIILISVAISLMLSACEQGRTAYEKQLYAEYDSTMEVLRASEDSLFELSPEKIRSRQNDSTCELWQTLRRDPEAFKGKVVVFPRLVIGIPFNTDDQLGCACGMNMYNTSVIISGKNYSYDYERESGMVSWPVLRERDVVRVKGIFTGLDRQGRALVNARMVEN